MRRSMFIALLAAKGENTRRAQQVCVGEAPGEASSRSTGAAEAAPPASCCRGPDAVGANAA